MHDTTNTHNLSAAAGALLATIERALDLPPLHYAAPLVPAPIDDAELATLVEVIHQTPGRTIHVTADSHGNRTLFVSDQRFARRQAPAVAFTTALLEGRGMREARRLAKAAAK